MIRKSGGLTEVSRPYEKCLRFGAAKLTDAELLAVIMRTGARGTGAVRLAEQVLSLRGEGRGLGVLPGLSVPELMTLPGIGEVKAIEICCVGEISRRIASSDAGSRLSIHDPSGVAEYYMELLRHDSQENIHCMMLDTRNHVLGEERLTRGTSDCSPLSTRDLFGAALRYRATGIILVHNHPSGDPTPSEADVLLTEKAREAGSLLDIRLLDHIIIGDRCYVSFADNGFFESSANGPDESKN